MAPAPVEPRTPEQVQAKKELICRNLQVIAKICNLNISLNLSLILCLSKLGNLWISLKFYTNNYTNIDSATYVSSNILISCMPHICRKLSVKTDLRLS